MLETRRVTHPWIQALPSPDIGRQRVFTACLWKVNRALADSPSAPVRTLQSLYCSGFGKGPVGKVPMERPARNSYLRILDSRGAPDRAAAASGWRGTNKISEASKTYYLR